MQAIELTRHHVARARRFDYEHDHGAARAHTHQRVTGRGKRRDAIMHHAPDVAQHGVIVGSQDREMRDHLRHGGGHANLLVPSPRQGKSGLPIDQPVGMLSVAIALVSASTTEPCSASWRTGLMGMRRRGGATVKICYDDDKLHPFASGLGTYPNGGYRRFMFHNANRRL